MTKLSDVVISLIGNINDTHSKGIEYVKKAIDNRISSIKEFHKSGGHLTELKEECKLLGINFIDTLKEKTDVSEKTSQRYRKLSNDERISKLLEDEDDSRLRGINNVGLMKFIEMSKLSDEDFETVVSGDDTPLNCKDKDTPPSDDESEDDGETPPSDGDNEDDNDTPPSDDENEDGAEIPPSDDESEDGAEIPPSDDESEDDGETPPSDGDNSLPIGIPDEYKDTLGDEYHTLMNNDKVFLVMRISDEIIKKQKLEEEILKLKLQLSNLSSNGEV